MSKELVAVLCELGKMVRNQRAHPRGVVRGDDIPPLRRACREWEVPMQSAVQCSHSLCSQASAAPGTSSCGVMASE